MIPISDHNPGRHLPIVTWAMIGICIDVFLWELSFRPRSPEILLLTYGFIPRNLFDHVVAETVYGIPWPWLTTITSMFFHAGFLHLGGNMLYLWIFGKNVEDAMGLVGFLFFYFACGIAAALTEAVVNPHAAVPMVGASGAISGVLAAYVLIYPRARIRVIIPLGILPLPAKVWALYVVGFWFFLQLANGLVVTPGNPPGSPVTAWWAHIGGFVCGLMLTPLMSSFPLFGRYTRGQWD